MTITTTPVLLRAHGPAREAKRRPYTVKNVTFGAVAALAMTAVFFVGSAISVLDGSVEGPVVRELTVGTGSEVTLGVILLGVVEQDAHGHTFP